MTKTNREFVDKRLRELSERRKTLESRLEELDSLASSKGDVQAIATEAMEFLAGLEFTLREGVPQEKLSTLRRCIERIHITNVDDATAVEARLLEVPAGNLAANRVIEWPVNPDVVRGAKLAL